MKININGSIVETERHLLQENNYLTIQCKECNAKFISPLDGLDGQEHPDKCEVCSYTIIN